MKIAAHAHFRVVAGAGARADLKLAVPPPAV
jgi:hypothetical protein